MKTILAILSAVALSIGSWLVYIQKDPYRETQGFILFICFAILLSSYAIVAAVDRVTAKLPNARISPETPWLDKKS